MIPLVLSSLRRFARFRIRGRLLTKWHDEHSIAYLEGLPVGSGI